MDGENPSSATVTPSVDIHKCFQLFVDSNGQWKKPLKGCLGNMGLWYPVMLYMGVIIRRYKDPITNQPGFHRR